MFLNINILKNCLFLDIETVSAKKEFHLLEENMQALWTHKCKSILKELKPDNENPEIDAYHQRAGIYAEFAKIVCISVGYVVFKDDIPNEIRIKSFAGDDESNLLSEFTALLETHYKNPEKDYLCGHNIKEFDIPFICRRMVIHGIKFPAILDLSGKKPWQTAHILDTMDLWRFGDYKNYTSLNLLAGTLSIPSPKDDIDGSMVGHVYWNENDLPKIVRYCEKDVLTVIQVMLKYAGSPLLEETSVFSATKDTDYQG
ncbi:MAG: ribonuclease H-like domain-containing protein [Saprospiraceae bacterium]|nr:ribonuclease H-like domain-containing protein [Saprospiraceae bacterium]